MRRVEVLLTRRRFVSVTTLGAAAVVDFAIAALPVVIALRFRQEHASTEARAAVAAFQVWWLGLGFTVFTNGAREAIAAFGWDATLAGAFNAWQFVYIIATCASVAGLLYYLIFLFTGHSRWLRPLVGFYVIYAIVALALLARLQPAGVAPGKWFVQWSYANPGGLGAAVLGLMSLLLLLPQIVAAALYVLLRRRGIDPAARRRVTIIGVALLVWLGSTLIAPFVQLGRFEAWQAGGRLVGLVASVAILRAYAESGDHAARVLARDAEAGRGASAASHAALLARARELI